MLFKIFPLKKTLHLFLILLTFSVVAAMATHIALGSFDTIMLFIGGSNSISVFSSGATLPQTGVISIELIDEIKGLKDVEVVSPEVLSLITINDHVLFLRGITPEALNPLYNPRLIEGELVFNDSNVLVGIRAAKLIGVKTHETIVIKGLTTSTSKNVEVKGIFETGDALDDEIVTNVSMGQFFRGFSEGTISMVRVKGSLSDLRTNIINQIGVNNITENVRNIFTDWARLMPTSTIVSASASENAKLAVEDILNRNISFSQSIVWALMSIVLGASAMSLYYAVSWIIIDLSPVIMILRAIGFSKTRIIAMLFLESAVVSLVASFLGYIVGYALTFRTAESGTLRILFHTIVLSFKLDTFLSLVLLPTALTLIFLFIHFRNISKITLT